MIPPKPFDWLEGLDALRVFFKLGPDSIGCIASIRFSLSVENYQAERDRMAEPVLRDQILRLERGQGNIHFSCSADHEQLGNRVIYTLLYKVCDDYTYML